MQILGVNGRGRGAIVGLILATAGVAVTLGAGDPTPPSGQAPMAPSPTPMAATPSTAPNPGAAGPAPSATPPPTQDGPSDWPQLRGPNHNGITFEKSWLDHWPSEGPKQAWKINVGIGASAVSICQGRLYAMGNAGGQDTVFCLDPDTGKEIWHFSYPCPFEERQYEGGTAGTPATDGQYVYTLSHKGYLVCLEAATGKKVWDKDLPKDLGGKPGGWGYAGTPLIEGTMLLIDNGGKGAANLALNRLTGEVVWKSGDGEAGYASAVAFTLSERRLALFFRGSTGLVGVEAATGKELWKIPWPTQSNVAAATPVVDGHLIFVGTGGTPGESGIIEVSDDKATVLWQNKVLKTHVATAVIWKGYIYGIHGQLGARNSQVKCVDLMTGQEKWKQGGFDTGSLILADGKLIVMGEKGELAVAPASPEGFKPTAQFRLFTEGRSWIEPVLSHGRLYCKTNQGDLYCLDLRPQPGTPRDAADQARTK